jgi:8-oxo-dGTP pyrophosphatase MutT (NUDIX family)
MKLTKDKIEELLQKEKPGLASHIKMAPEHRQADMANFDLKNARKSAVMIILYHDASDLKVVLIRRGKYVGIHSGQIAFPGGRYEETDLNVRTTAIREIEEEIGIKEKDYNILGRLTDIYVPPSNFIVSVFVAYMHQKPVFRIDPREVDEVLTFSLTDFVHEAAIGERYFFVQSNNLSALAPCYLLDGAELWGASAMVMTELIDMLYAEEQSGGDKEFVNHNIRKQEIV